MSESMEPFHTLDASDSSRTRFSGARGYHDSSADFKRSPSKARLIELRLVDDLELQQSVAAKLEAMSSPVPFAGCHIWTGPLCSLDGKHAKGAICIKGTQLIAYRAAWTLRRGLIPDGHFGCHRCDTPLCINVDHMFTGTLQENKADEVSKGRHNHGFRGTSSKLTPELLAVAKRMADAGSNWAEIGRAVGIHRSNVSRAIRGMTYRSAS